MVNEFTISLTGAAGNIGSNLIFLLAKDFQPLPNCLINLKLIDLNKYYSKMQGLKLELEDCFFPRLNKIEIFEDCEEAFVDSDLFIICGAKPRMPGMQRKDLLEKNVMLIKKQAELINRVYQKGRILIVSNPCNTLSSIF